MITRRFDRSTARLSAEEVCPRPIRVFSEILQFLRRHLVQLLIFAPGAFVLMAVHESTHAVMALARGGVSHNRHRSSTPAEISFRGLLLVRVGIYYAAGGRPERRTYVVSRRP